MAQRVKRLPAMRETRVRSLGRENPLEKEGHGNPTPVFLPGESHGWRSRVGYVYSPWGHRESDTTENTNIFNIDNPQLTLGS